jgi:hypothetical protein
VSEPPETHTSTSDKKSYIQQYVVIRVRNAQLGVYNRGVEREFGQRLRGAILGFLAIKSGCAVKDPIPL